MIIRCVCLIGGLLWGVSGVNEAGAHEDPVAVSIVRNLREVRREEWRPSYRDRYLRGLYSPERLANEFGIRNEGR